MMSTDKHGKHLSAPNVTQTRFGDFAYLIACMLTASCNCRSVMDVIHIIIFMLVNPYSKV